MPNSWLCVDANLIIRLVVDVKDDRVRQLWARWGAEGRNLAAPNLLPYELANALYRYQRQGWLSREAVRLALDAALALPVRLYGDADLYRKALELAGQFSLPSAYDAHYLAVASRLGAEFWTADQRLGRAVQPTLEWVRVME
jgi:predicted nucleic acid-binding protein